MSHGRSRTGGIAVLTVSDTRDSATDTSGALARELLAAAGHRIVASAILPDEPELVSEQVLRWIADDDVDAIVITGGTGIARRDRTYEAVVGVLDQRLDGFGELFRALSFDEIGSRAMLTRAVGGIARGTVVFALPGSTAAVQLGVERLLVPELAHVFGELDR